ncbi:hypothetical protein ID0178_14190 [Helicobacter pylori]
MLLSYDFLEFVDEPHKSTFLTSMIDKAMADKKLARQNKPRVRIKDNLSLRATLDAFGEELSRLKYDMIHKAIKGSTIESSNLNSIVNKIKSGLPFGTISAFRPFKDAFIKDFTEKERELLIEAYKSGYKASQLDKVAKNWNNDPNPIDASYLADAFLREYRTIALKLSTALGKSFVSKFLNPKSKATMKDFMSSDKFVKRYRYTYKDNVKRTQELKSLLDKKRHFLGYLQVTGYWKENTDDAMLPDKEVSFFVFSHQPMSLSFDLASELLLLGRHFDQEAICYCENAIVLQNDRYQVELVSTLPNDIGEVWATFDSITFSTPSELPNALTKLRDQVYTFFEKNPEKDKYGVAFEDLVVKSKITAMKLPINFYERLEVADLVKSSIRARQNCSRTNGYQKLFLLEC